MVKQKAVELAVKLSAYIPPSMNKPSSNPVTFSTTNRWKRKLPFIKETPKLKEN